jgi:cysteine desulfurase/selenocysteine lyase
VSATAVAGGFDVARVRADFPVLARMVRAGRPLVYLDNAATAQKPRSVIEATERFYAEDYASVHRGVHYLSERATLAYEQARAKAAAFLGAREPREVVFVRGTTEGLNLVAFSFARPRLRPGDEVLLTAMEHHSNIVPWQLVCEERGARVRVLPMDRRGVLDLDALPALLTERTRVIAVTHVSNSLGTVNPVREIVGIARTRGIPVVVDGAQAVPHFPVDVVGLDCDFYACSGHKMFGPTGIGLLYGRAELLEAMPPYQGGGSMIANVTFERTTYAAIPARFEAGTPDIAGAIGLGAAVDYAAGLPWDAVQAHEAELLAYATERLGEIPGVTIVGQAPHKASVLSFTLDGVHPHDVGTVVDQEGVAVRAGHHCTQPVMDFFGIPATTRASFAFYNTREDADALVRAVRRARELFG